MLVFPLSLCSAPITNEDVALDLNKLRVVVAHVPTSQRDINIDVCQVSQHAEELLQIGVDGRLHFAAIIDWAVCIQELPKMR
jgi:hypothetical protein